jgi:hypothetical protein
MARPTLIQGGPAFFTPEGYVPPVQPEQAFLPTDVMRDPIADMFAAQPPLTRGPSLPKMINPPKPPDQIFIDDMPPMREKPPIDFPIQSEDMIPGSGTENDSGGGRLLGAIREAFENNPNVRIGGPFLGSYENQMPKRDDFMSIGGPGGGFDNRLDLIPQVPQDPQPIPQVPPSLPIVPPMKEIPSVPMVPPMREVPPEDFGFGPGIRRSEDLFRGEDLVMPPMAPPKPLGEDVPPMPMENIIRANDPAIMPMPAKMPMLPEPMPMPTPMPMPKPMPMRPRMPMPGPIATPMPMAPTNLQLPQIETQMPMMSLGRGIGSFRTLV